MADITIYTLAKELNMTPSMVSRAFSPTAKISEEKRRIVLEAAEKYGFSPNKLASRLSMKNVRIGILINSCFAINTDKMVSGIEQAYAELKDYKISYEVTSLGAERDTDEEIRRALDIYKTYDGVILADMSADRYAPMIDALYRANPNVVQVQAINQNVPCLFSSKHDEKTASSLAAEFLGSCLRFSVRKNILLFTGDQKSALHLRAAEAFSEACDAMGLSLLPVVDMKDSEAELERLLPLVFARYADDIDGIYITSGLSVPLCRYLEENGFTLPFVAFDTYEDIKRYVEKGIISAAISQNVSRQMKIAFEMLVMHLITGRDCPQTVYTDVHLALKSNIHQFD